MSYKHPLCGFGHSFGVRALSSGIVAAGLFFASPAMASLWESENWAATGDLAGKAGYDSNLTLSNSGPGDYFLQVNPAVTVLRRNSTTDLRFRGNLIATEYLQGEQPQQNDLRLQALYAYPLAENVNPVYQAKLLWTKASEPNPYLGRRVEYIKSAVVGEGYVPITGKIGLRGSVDFDSSRYEDSLNHNTRLQSFVGVAYKRSPLTEISLNVGGGVGRSTPPGVGTPVKSRETYVTLRLRGEITAKISGSIHGGFGQVDYTGGYVNNYNLPVAGADLTWGIDPRRTLVLAAYSGADYTPDGQSVNNTRAFLSFNHVIINRWEYTLRGGPSHSTFRREFRQRTDDGWELGAEFAYKPSDRFRVSTGIAHTNQDSDIAFNQFDRTVFSLGSAYRF